MGHYEHLTSQAILREGSRRRANAIAS